MNRYFCRSGRAIELGREIGSGGEGKVFEVVGDTASCAKIYSPLPSGDYLRKLSVMVATSPADPTWVQRKHHSIAWPQDVLFEDAQGARAAGLLMPRIDTKTFRKALSYIDPGSRVREVGGGFTWRYLHVAALNIASSVGAIHERGHCVGDLNESNLLVAPNSLISIIDCDSFQIVDRSARKVFRCRVGKPEYTAPELQGRRYEDVDRTLETDRFALAVLIFQLLMEGTHPYQARGKAVEDLATTQQKIIKGLFPYGKCPRGVSPPAFAPPFEILEPEVQKLFQRCFVDGHREPGSRPSALEWFEALRRCDAKFCICSVNSNHVYLPHYRQCPWCARRKESRDPFPPSLGRQVALDDPTRDLASPEDRRSYLLSFVEIALADGVLTHQEREHLINLGLSLQFKRQEIEGLIDGEVKKAAGKQAAAAVPKLALDKAEFQFQGVPQDSQITDGFTISNQGGGTLSGSLRSNKAWLLCPEHIDTSKHFQRIEFRVDTHGLSLGLSEVGEIDIISNGGNRKVLVSLAVELPEKALGKFKLRLGALAAALGLLYGLVISRVFPNPQLTSTASLVAGVCLTGGAFLSNSSLGCASLMFTVLWMILIESPLGTGLASGPTSAAVAWALVFISAASLTGKWTFKLKARGHSLPYPFLLACGLQALIVFWIPSMVGRPIAPNMEGRVEEYRVQVTGDVVNVRAQPSANGTILQKVAKGTILEVQAEDGDWRRVALNSGNANPIGWIHQSFVQRVSGVPEEANSSTPMPLDPSAPQETEVVAEKGEDPPPLPYKDEGACPFEGCTYREWTVTEETIVKESPDSGASTAFVLEKGEIVQAETGFVLTLRAGLARVIKETRIGSRQANPGDTVYLLHYSGEGFFLVWFNGETEALYVASEDEQNAEASLVMVQMPDTVWWVKVKNGWGGIGWTSQTKNFGNMDALGKTEYRGIRSVAS